MTVTGVDDTQIDGPQASVVTLTVDDVASDDAFDAAPDQKVAVTTTDNDSGRLIVSKDTLSVAEGGTSEIFTVSLAARPVGDVVIDVSSDDASEATVSPARLAFTPSDWNVPQSVTVTGVDDPEVDGPQASEVTLAVDDAASDDAFDVAADHKIAVTTADNDVALHILTGQRSAGDEMELLVPEGETNVYRFATDRPASFRLERGDDGALFTISNTGQLTFNIVTDFERPQDLDRDNIYQIALVATGRDGVEARMQVSIQVTDIDEAQAVYDRLADPLKTSVRAYAANSIRDMTRFNERLLVCAKEELRTVENGVHRVACIRSPQKFAVPFDEELVALFPFCPVPQSYELFHLRVLQAGEMMFCAGHKLCLSVYYYLNCMCLIFLRKQDNSIIDKVPTYDDPPLFYSRPCYPLFSPDR